MPNDRLRTAMLERGITPAELATSLQVDPKSVERWINGRTPYRRHRYAVAAHLGVDETYLWPDALSPEQVANASESEIVNVYAHRWTVPSDLWRQFFDNAEHDIGVLVYSGLFLAEDAGVHRIFRRKAEAGATVRILLGDPDSDPVAERGADEGIDDTMAAKIRNAMVLYKPLRGIDGIELTWLPPIWRASSACGTSPPRWSEHMGRRIDYYDDPDAPPASSIVPSANVVVVNDAGQILLIHRTDNDNWALPGGAMDLGESLPQAAVRETVEETGIQVEITGLVGIYTDPRHVILYTSNGEARQEFSIVFIARPLAGEPTPSAESREVHWVAPEAIAQLPMDRSMRMRIEHYLHGSRTPHLG